MKLPAWTAGVGLFWLYYTRLVPSAYPDLDEVSGLVEGPAGRLYTGPGYGVDELTYERFIVGGYGLYVLMLVALMNILLVVRHTRLEEQTGRAELVLGSPTARRAPLTAALALAVLTSLVVTATVALVTVTSPHMSPGGSLLFAAGVGVTGLAFAGLAALTSQLTEFSRGAAGLAGGGLGVAFLVRALGDMAEEGGSTLSWLSPLAWAQQTAPFVLDRWWPLALPLLFAAGTTAGAYALAERRDLGAGLLAVRTGATRAPGWLRSPLTLWLRLQRASILGWTASLAVGGAAFGAWTDTLMSSFEDLPDALIDVTGGDDDILAGYLGFLGLFMALLAGIYVVLAVQHLRTEETSGRGEPVLATPTSRRTWLGTHLLVTVGGTLSILATTGLATGVSVAAVTGEAHHVWDLTIAHLGFLPALLVLLGLAALLFGVAPRWIGVTWGLLALSLVTDVFGPLMDLPSGLTALSPFGHVARAPLEDLRPLPLLVLSCLGAALAAGGLLGFRRRDLESS